MTAKVAVYVSVFMKKKCVRLVMSEDKIGLEPPNLECGSCGHTGECVREAWKETNELPVECCDCQGKEYDEACSECRQSIVERMQDMVDK